MIVDNLGAIRQTIFGYLILCILSILELLGFDAFEVSTTNVYDPNILEVTLLTALSMKCRPISPLVY